MNTKCMLVSDFAEVCRICMKFDETFLPISSSKIIEMIVACASVQIWANDELPNQICNPCFLHLQNTVNFKQLCEKSDTTFRQIIQQSQVKIEDSDNSSYKADNIQNEFTSVKIEKDNFSDDDISNNSFKNEDDFENTNQDESSGSDETKKKLKPYECEKCHQAFKKAYNLGYHMKRAHKAKGIKCAKCSVVCYHSLHLNFHEKTHLKYTFSCEICNKNFSDIYKLKRHKFSHGERKFSCSKCDLTFKETFTLKKHVKTVHTAEQYEACHVCGKSFKKIHFAKHLSTHGERVTLSCDVCSKQFYYKYNLDQHVKHVHENVARERNHLCNICGMGFQKMDDLRRHFVTHTKEKPYECDKCDKKYGRKYSLTTHISRTHLNQRNHICSFCSQAFYNKDMLKNHVRRHTGEKPYQCHVCDKAFIQKVALNLHMKVHANSI